MRDCSPTIVSLCRDVVRQQVEAWDALDTKAAFLFGAILVAIGLLLGRSTGSFYWLGLVAWVAAIVDLLVMLTPRSCGQSPGPAGVLQYVNTDQPEADTLHAILDSMARVYEANRTIHERRVLFLKIGFVLTALGLVFQVASFALAA